MPRWPDEATDSALSAWLSTGPSEEHKRLVYQVLDDVAWDRWEWPWVDDVEAGRGHYVMEYDGLLLALTLFSDENPEHLFNLRFIATQDG